MASNYLYGVRIVSGTTPCQFYNIFYDTVSINTIAPLWPSLNPAINVPLSDLNPQYGGVTVKLPDTSRTIIISGTCALCNRLVFTQKIADYTQVSCSNNIQTVCSSIIVKQVWYAKDTDLYTQGLRVGLKLFLDERLTIPFTGFTYIIWRYAFPLPQYIFQVNPVTGQVIAQTQQLC